ncbi:ATP-binding protein [Clostridium sp. E02]|uniref:ATP-binding protein n=1 Tax=Clostridium sp. E02 TaxID=2487134 RepID=UPI000F544BC4|nr:ATP-binding protein [Clostridium sp. E02]
MKSQELILYRNLKYKTLFDQMTDLLLETDKNKRTMSDAFACAGQLIELADAYGFEGNLWHCFLTYCLTENENPYSTSCEIKGADPGTLKQLAFHDLKKMKELFELDIRILDEADEGVFASICEYQSGNSMGKFYHKQIRDEIISLAKALKDTSGLNEFAEKITEFYGRFGVGNYGLNKAFRLEESGDGFAILPVTNVESIRMDDIIGYQLQKKKLIENTEAFLDGKAANNVLLFGDSGTGKSSSIKAILNEYYDRGLRMIEVYKHQFPYLTKIQEQIKDRNYKFIIYMDDLSFEDTEVEYKYLKAIIEGGLGKKPENVLIYATSNRRHLIRETFQDKRQLDEELHTNDTVQEKLSLAARFGVTVYYGSPDKSQFKEIVKKLAERYQISMPLEQLYAEANMWELSHGGLSGRTANQFIVHLLGKMVEI